MKYRGAKSRNIWSWNLFSKCNSHVRIGTKYPKGSICLLKTLFLAVSDPGRQMRASSLTIFARLSVEPYGYLSRIITGIMVNHGFPSDIHAKMEPRTARSGVLWYFPLNVCQDKWFTFLLKRNVILRKWSQHKKPNTQSSA